jgi:hypothetical protein
MAPDEWRQRWSLHTAGSLRARARELAASASLIKGLLPTRSIAILVGDSGLGKSPLVYQVALCVAAGVPFLGRETLQGRVVLADFENGIGEMDELVERISRHLGLPEPPKDLYFWSPNACETGLELRSHTLMGILRDVSPALAIVDSMGSFNPEAEDKNAIATYMLREFRNLARDRGTATVFVHHRRKQPRKAEESAGPLEKADLRQWFQDSRGASSLINGSDIRLGVDEPDKRSVEKEEVSLVLRGFGRVRGEIGPFYLARATDDNDEAIGYRRLTGPELLFNEYQKTVLDTLPHQFTFKQAKGAYGRADQPTSNFLQHCINLELIRNPGRGQYEKTLQQNCEDNVALGYRS